MNRTPGTVWVAFIMGLIGLVQNLWPSDAYQTTVLIVLVGNFAAGMLEAYWPLLEQQFNSKQPNDAAFSAPQRVGFGKAVNRALWG